MKMKRAIIRPLALGAKVSDIDPAATVSDGAQQNPAAKRRKQNAPKLRVRPAPRVNRAPSGKKT